MINNLTLPGLSVGEEDLVNQMVTALRSKFAHNMTKERYYNAETTVKNLGISVPKQLEFLNPRLGWPGKAVDTLANRLEFQGFVMPDGREEAFGLDQILEDNLLVREASDVHTSHLIYGVSYVGIMSGDPMSGEPEVIVRGLSARSTIGAWNPITRRLKAAVTVLSWDQSGQPTAVILYLPDRVDTYEKTRTGWNVDSRPHNIGVVPVVMMPFNPSLENPYGQSRITKEVISIMDRTLRTLLRLEISAEFHARPQKVILGISEEDLFEADGSQREAFDMSTASIMALDGGPAGQVDVKQLSQSAMTPHLEMIRNDASLMAGAASIPVSELGIMADSNPTSAESLETQWSALVRIAENAQLTLGSAWEQVARIATAVRDGGFNRELAKVSTKWGDAMNITKQARAQAVSMEIASGVLAPDSPLTLEKLGYSQSEITRRMAEIKSAQRQGRLDQLSQLASGGSKQAPEAPVVEEGEDA